MSKLTIKPVAPPTPTAEAASAVKRPSFKVVGKEAMVMCVFEEKPITLLKIVVEAPKLRLKYRSPKYELITPVIAIPGLEANYKTWFITFPAPTMIISVKAPPELKNKMFGPC